MQQRTIQVPSEALVLAQHFEGLFLKPYRCPAGVPTIGYGHVIPSMAHPPITKAQAVAFLDSDMAVAVAGALRYCPKLIHDQRKLAAVADFVFNLGAGRLRISTLRRRINEEDWKEAARELSKWVWGGGKKLPGLILRRKAESLLLCN